MRECNEYEITVEKLLKVVHRYTEKIVIHVVSDSEMIQDRTHEFYITRNFSESQEEMDRVLKYYADVPVWNLAVGFEYEHIHGMKGKHIVCYINANCHYRDAREGFLREKEDLRKERRKEYRRRRKIDEEPTIDAEPVKRGMWLTHGNTAICSVCGQWCNQRELTYCANCGAKMRRNWTKCVD